MKKIIIIFLGIIIIITGIIGYKYYADKKKEIYNLRLTSVANKISEQEKICENISYDIIKAWNKDIVTESSYADLVELRQNPNEKKLMHEIDLGKNEVEAKMKLIQNPPDKYKQKYDLLVEFYNKYKHLYKQVTEFTIGASGLDETESLESYDEDIKDTKSDFNEIKHELQKNGF